MRNPKDVLNQVNGIFTSGLIDESDTAFSVYDFQVLDAKIEEVKSTFPSFWQHTMAVKANPLAAVLYHATKHSIGLEAASFEEVLLSQKSGAGLIIWDSPVKTTSEILLACSVKQPLLINANSLTELKRLSTTHEAQNDHVRIGLRINPQVSLSSYASMSVGGVYSKFGEPICNSDEIAAFIQNSNQKIGLHVHASSQNFNVTETVNAIAQVYNLAMDIGIDHISYVDIGGGFPVNYGQLEPPTMQQYSVELKSACPALFDGSIDVYTEFGRFYHANAGFSVSSIHEVKSFDEHQIIIQHLGADMFLRESYEPGKWFHRMMLLGKDLNEKTNYQISTDIGGPLCFGGDFIAKNKATPEALAGDYLIILDTGANSYALWSKHCSRALPKIIGITSSGEFEIIKSRQPLNDIIDFWA